tara:strand:- start:353 stop:820 length:468 start_codon:yes stop_codon:yes gene_type:complete
MKGKVDYKKYLKETFTNKVNKISIKGYNKSYLKNDKKFIYRLRHLMAKITNSTGLQEEKNFVFYLEELESKIIGIVVGVESKDKTFGPYYFSFCAKKGTHFPDKIRKKKWLTMTELIDDSHVSLDSVVLEKDLDIAILKLKLLLKDKGWNVSEII